MKLRHVFAVVAAVALTHSAAKAEGIYTPPSVKDVVEAPKGNPWTGAYVEGAVGLSVGNVEVSENADSITFGDSSFAGHVGVGYDHAFKGTHVVAGVLGRYNLSDIAFKAEGETLADAKHAWLVGGRIGYAPGPWMAYLLAGYQFSKLKIHDFEIDDVDTSSWVLGAGLEVLLGNGVFAGLEYTVALKAGENFTETGCKVCDTYGVDATEHVGKVRFGYKF